MRIVAWNCQQEVVKKFPALERLDADILVLSEAADVAPDGWTRQWIGANPNKGLAVMARPGDHAGGMQAVGRTSMTRHVMPPEYDAAFMALLAASARAATDPEALVVPFWPLVGWEHTGELMVIGRSVNGWVEDWPIGDLRDPMTRVKVARAMRANAEETERCRMLWVTDLAGKTEHSYNTNQSAFWRVLREIVARLTAIEGPSWPSHLAWTNLYKLSPAAGWNPGADLLRAQRDAATALLRIEIESLQPRRILAMTGIGWIEPFLEPLGIDVERRVGLVEGVAIRGDARVIVARHPIAKPHRKFVDEVTEALAE